MFLGHAEDGVAGIETALRLSPHSPIASLWQSHLCYLHNLLGRWEQVIDWCEKAVANNVRDKRAYALAALAGAYAWTGRDSQANDAVARLHKADPGFTVQTWADLGPTLSDDPTFKAQWARVVKCLRKAGVPEGPAKTN